MISITSTESIEEIVRTVSRSGIEIMGDNMIGFKFLGEGSSFWNDLLLHLYNEGAEVSEVFNGEWLLENGISYLEYESQKWNG